MNTLSYGKTAAGRDQALLVAEDGTLQSSATLSGGGDASATNQTTEITKLTSIDTNQGAAADVAATADTGTFSLIAITKRIVAKLTSIIAKQPALGTAGTASADVITVQGVASMTALSVTDTRLPTALGGTTAANSLPVTLSSDGPFVIQTGAITETAPATDTASSGLNGRLQRIAQRITSMIALLPAALGQGTMAQSLRVVLPSDQAAIPISTVAIPTVIYNGLTNVTTAGTRVVLAASQAVLSGVTVKAKAANTGIIYVGSSTVAAANGYQLAAGDSTFLEIANLNTVNIDSSVNGEGVTYIAS